MRILLVLIVSILLMVFAVACGSGNSGPKFGTGVLKQPTLSVEQGAKVDLPLLLWPSFEYRMIDRRGSSNLCVVRGKEEFCIINESTASKLQIGEKVEILDEARCLYVRLNTIDGVPRSYTATINQIRVISTGEEGWTWSKAIEFDKK